MTRSVVVKTGASRYEQEIAVGPHRLRADEPREVGGDDEGPNPYELLLAALGACTGMTLSMYAERKRWPLRAVVVRLAHSRIHDEDCADCDTRQVMLDNIETEITLIGELSDEQRHRLLEIADRCPVHRTLESEVRIRTTLTPYSPDQ